MENKYIVQEKEKLVDFPPTKLPTFCNHISFNSLYSPCACPWCSKRELGEPHENDCILYGNDGAHVTTPRQEIRTSSSSFPAAGQ
jgi:hypothetical protein